MPQAYSYNLLTQTCLHFRRKGQLTSSAHAKFTLYYYYYILFASMCHILYFDSAKLSMKLFSMRCVYIYIYIYIYIYVYSIYLFFFLLSDSGLNMKYSVTENMKYNSDWNATHFPRCKKKILIYNRAVVW